MKTKIIAGLVGMCIVLPALFFIQWPILDVLLVIFAALAAFELCSVTGIKNLPLKLSAVIAAPLTILLVSQPMLQPVALPIMMAVGLAMVVIFLAAFKKNTTFQQLMFACMGAFLIPAAAATLLLVRNMMLADAHSDGRSEARFFVLIIFTCAWLTDAMAYFCGKAFGKRKLCPNISPNKTWAGAIGGVLCTMAVNMIIAGIWTRFDLFLFLAVGVISLVLCPIAIMGDLLASTLKRNLGIKDFGRIMPGHGGALDRCDSYLLVAPVMWAIFAAVGF